MQQLCANLAQSVSLALPSRGLRKCGDQNGRERRLTVRCPALVQPVNATKPLLDSDFSIPVRLPAATDRLRPATALRAVRPTSAVRARSSAVLQLCSRVRSVLSATATVHRDPVGSLPAATAELGRTSTTGSVLSTNPDHCDPCSSRVSSTEAFQEGAQESSRSSNPRSCSRRLISRRRVY